MSLTPPRGAVPARQLLALAATFTISACQSDAARPASPALAIINARVWTGDSAAPWAEAIATNGDTITAVGTTAAITASLASGTRTIDAKGALVTPGFIDSHVHFASGGFALASVKLRDASTKAEFIRRIAAFARATPKGTWIRHGDWDHQAWGGELPVRAWIDSVTPDHPVWISRTDGHMYFANSATLRAASVTKATPDVAGGTIVRDAQGEPTGIFKDNANDLIEKAIPPRSVTEWDACVESATTFLAANGVTTVAAMEGWDELPAFQRARASGRLKTRVMMATPLAAWPRLKDEIAKHGRGDNMLRLGRLKAFADGALGSHTAAMLAPFSDTPRDSGFYLVPPESLYVWTKGADAAGLQVGIHAIGDLAIRTVLDIFERVAKENGARDRRFRIEHAQHVAPPDFARFGAMGIIPSMQPYHAIDDGRWADKPLGPARAKGTYAFRSMLDAHAPLAFGSDWTVAPPNVMEGLQAAVTRRTLDGKHPGGWVPEQKITLEEALVAYTRGSARASFQEAEVGVLRRGMLADIVVLDRDITKVAPEAIGEARVMVTVLGGRVIFERAVP